MKSRVAGEIESNKFNIILRIREIVEQGLGHLFVTSSCSLFFNKTDFKQYLFNFEKRHLQKKTPSIHQLVKKTEEYFPILDKNVDNTNLYIVLPRQLDFNVPAVPLYPPIVAVKSVPSPTAKFLKTIGLQIANQIFPYTR